MGILYGENCMILTSSIFDWCTHVTDRRMHDRRTGDSIYALSHNVVRTNLLCYESDPVYVYVMLVYFSHCLFAGWCRCLWWRRDEQRIMERIWYFRQSSWCCQQCTSSMSITCIWPKQTAVLFLWLCSPGEMYAQQPAQQEVFSGDLYVGFWNIDYYIQLFCLQYDNLLDIINGKVVYTGSC